MSIFALIIGAIFGGMAVFVAGSLWFFGLIDSGRIFYR